MAIDGGSQQLMADFFPVARSYQLEALEKALKQNTIVYLETGSGKTLIAIMLLRSYAHLLRKPSPFIAVFLVPTVVLVAQQGESVAMLTDLKVGMYYGELGVDYWDAVEWKLQKNKNEVLVMTPQILLDALRHSFLRLDQIKVLIFDECHNARGKHPYSCIMTEFYHRELSSNNPQLPRVFGMTASPIKAKALSSRSAYWEQISELESLMNSKVFTCKSDSVLSQYVPFSTPKVKIYRKTGVPHTVCARIAGDLSRLITKHELSLHGPNISTSDLESAIKRLHKLLSTFRFCLEELGIWLTLKAAEVFSLEEADILSWGRLDISGETVLGAFSLDVVQVLSAFFPADPNWSVRHDIIANVKAGYLTSKVLCLIDTLLEYRDMKNLRCIVFVKRIVTAIVICHLLNELLPELTGWSAEYTAGNNSRFRSQSRKEQNKIVDEFRNGTVNIIISTSMLEEGLDVQSCNLVIRFDPSATICSFIQSRGRARMQNSDFVLMVESEDTSALSQVKNYLAGGEMMRSECLSHADFPCEPLGQMYSEPCYEVKTTRAIVNLSSSVSLIYFYCSRLPSDGYFKPYPHFKIFKEVQSCTLLLPNSCPIPIVEVQGSIKVLKQLACLEACKQLHQVGELTDNLVPNTLEEEADTQESRCEPYAEDHAKYFPPELVHPQEIGSQTLYHCYLIELNPNFQDEVKLQDIVLAVPTRLGYDLEMIDLDLEADRGKIIMSSKYLGCLRLTSAQISLCRSFQIILFRVLLNQNFNQLHEDIDQCSLSNGSRIFNYLLFPSTGSSENLSVDWKCVTSVLYLSDGSLDKHNDCFATRDQGHYVHTKNGLVCSCMLENSLVCTPHNGLMYCISGTLDGYDGNSNFELRNGEVLSYKKYYEKKHGIKLQFEGETLLYGKRMFTVHNYLQRCRTHRSKEPSNSSYELPPELCFIIMSPITISTFFSFSFIPSIMHRIESLLIAANLKSLHMDFCTPNIVIPTLTILEAITTKKCQEKIHLESLETLGDSFIKYATSQQLFKMHQNNHEGLLSTKREKIISNANLCKLGCVRKITGFIRNEPFDPKTWIIPGSYSANHALKEELVSSKKIFSKGSRKIKSKTIADVVEALVGAFLRTGGEMVALSFMAWLGIDVDFVNVPYTRHFPVNPERHVNVKFFESLLNYQFHDVSLLVEALTHGSYMLPEIPRCYQRLEFLGDAVLDYLITLHLYCKYPGLSPGLLTDLRSASTNNDFYAQSAIQVGLHKHILHASQALHCQIVETVKNCEQSFPVSAFGQESETSFPKVLADVIESVAGAILVDSGYNKEIVFQSLRRLIDPLITPDTLTTHPIRELTELCQKEQYTLKKPVVSHQNGVAYVTVEVEANGMLYRESRTAADRKTAKKLAHKTVLESLKESMGSCSR
ncbi:endoribonuclease Dicer homolog 2-like [Primulina eburnea]|uniref:endoribonuclease Dicer homolog 2-like n=1 Tax=Primulina eburnea TaxID=1245227 RepID=UPI003C6C0B0B